MTRNSSSSRSHLRERITQLAARFMAEDGIDDFALAKRKAARQLGAADTQNLPNNSEIEQALRDYQALYQRDEQHHRLRELRMQAVRVMRELAPFDPHLTGAVLTGIAARYSAIQLMLFTDSPKDVELFWLNRNLAFKASEKRYRFSDSVRPIPVLILTGSGDADVSVAIFSTADLKRVPLSSIDGRAIEKARLPTVEAMLDT